MFENLFVGIAEGLRSSLGGLPLELTETIVMLVKLVGILLFVLIGCLWLVYQERKIAGFMQARIGPNRTGPKGLLQTTATIGKLISKEIFINKGADKIPFLAAAILCFVPTLMVLAVIPFGKNMAAIDMNIGLFYLLAISSLGTIFFWLSGWASNSKYSLLGGMRSVAQMVSYELPLVIIILGVVMLAGTLNMSGIIEAQEHTWFIFTQPIAFIIYFICGLAECNRTPFDLIEGESELVQGFSTEYSGMAFAMFYLAEYANMIVICCVGTILFLGGWQAPFGWDFIPSWLWFFVKMSVLMFLMMQIRWTYPRLRVDQLMGFGWKVLLPLSLANVFITGAGMYIYRAIGW